LYAFAASAAAFAGERESRTLAFLDTVPVPRSTLWGGKVSFAFASTLALALVLVALSLIGTLPWLPAHEFGLIAIELACLLIEAVAWGLFWSALLENALLAAVVAIVSVALADLGLVRLVGHWFRGSRPGESLLESIPVRLAVALILLIASRFLIVPRSQ